MSSLLLHLSKFIQHGHLHRRSMHIIRQSSHDACTFRPTTSQPLPTAQHSPPCLPVDISKLWPSVPFTVLWFRAILEVTYMSQIHRWWAVVHGTIVSAYQRHTVSPRAPGCFYTLVLMDINAIRIYGHALCGGLCSINACQHGSVAVIMQQAVLDAGGFIGKQELQEYMT